MKSTILVAGGTGNLGGRIIKELLAKGAQVRAIVRPETDPAKVEKLEQSGVEVVKVNMADIAELTGACQGVSCVVSALAGLRDAIVDTQTMLLNAAVAAGVPRFISSDFSSDFTKLAEGDNRNFDLRKEFKVIIDQAPIKATSIFNGAFAEVLQYNMPFLNRKDKTVGYVDDADRRVDFTTMDNTAAFTAAVALDDDSPRDLRISGFQPNANEMAAIASEVFGAEFKTIQMGNLTQLAARNKADRAADPAGEEQLYPRWQQSQYFHSMFSVLNEPLDNDRYTGIAWTNTAEFLSSLK
jgi:nucleoside-diphosphate-sugar epimerase